MSLTHKLFGGKSSDEQVSCRSCNWAGIIGETKEIPYTSPKESWKALGGREGLHYLCPKCNKVVSTFYWRIS